MFWHEDAIKGLGWKSVEDFVKDFVGVHSNCCIKYTSDGVYLDYDLDGDIIDKFNSIGCTSFSLTCNPEARELFKEDALNDRVEKFECSVEDFKQLGYTDEEAEEIFKHVNIYI